MTNRYANLMSISTLRNVKLNYLYVITKENYGLLKGTVGNRGGKDNARAKYYSDAIKNGTFDFDLYRVDVAVVNDMEATTIEGHHKVDALMEHEEDIVVRIVPPKTLTQISSFHSGINPKWKKGENFKAAITAGSATARLLDTLRFEFCEKHKVDKSKVSEGEMYSILVKDAKYCSGGKNAPTVGMWLSDTLFPLANKTEFRKTLKLYIELKSQLKSIRDAYKIGKAVIELHYDDKSDFQLDAFVNAVSYDGFVMDKYSIPTIKAKALAMYQKQVKLSKVA